MWTCSKSVYKATLAYTSCSKICVQEYTADGLISEGVSLHSKEGLLLTICYHLCPPPTGTNLQSLIDHTQSRHCVSAAEIVLVISNKPGVQGLKRAEAAGIPTKVKMGERDGGR